MNSMTFRRLIINLVPIVFDVNSDEAIIGRLANFEAMVCQIRVTASSVRGTTTAVGPAT